MIDINCDMGEGLNNEAALMPFIHSANIACGYHAGDEATMRMVIELCIKHKVNIGAHPSFNDRANFGRTQMHLPNNEVYDLVIDQLKTIDAIASQCGGKLHHVKPHGALYNMAAGDEALAGTIVKAVKDFDDSLIYYGLSGSVMLNQAEAIGLSTAHEVFADRSYQPDGTLTPRSSPGALHGTIDDVLKQVREIIKEKTITAKNGERFRVKADTICIHGDGMHAIDFAKAIYNLLHEN